MRKIIIWIEAMRLRTLPVSLAGVMAGVAMALMYPGPRQFSLITAILCVTFALLAQIASNFANEYFDYVGGIDRRGREGPRRGVTEGDITPRAMLIATWSALALAGCAGLGIAWIGGWWLIAVGICVAVGVFAYSAGPYPLSHHALGEIAVVVFYGILPVTFTHYVLTGRFAVEALWTSIAFGLMGANVLIVNNYRDRDDDRAVKKRTLAVVAGRRFCAYLYLINGVLAFFIMTGILSCWTSANSTNATSAVWLARTPYFYILLHILLFSLLTRREGARLTTLLGMTASLMAAFALAILILLVATV